MSPTVPERALLLAAGVLLGGCASLRAPAARPEVAVQCQVHPRLTRLEVGRIGVLPFHQHAGDQRQAGTVGDAVQVSLRQMELGEVVALDPRELGPELDPASAVWGAGNPRELLIQAHRRAGADSVLFGTLTHTRIYGEPAIGLELVLVDATDGRVLWVADDVLDSRVPGVREALGAFRRLERGEVPASGEEDPRHVPFDSFARFVARSFAMTLQERM